jgi:hypothetical protein
MAGWRRTAAPAAAVVALAALAGGAPAGAQELEDFTVRDAGSLADLCSTAESSALYPEARQHCYGFIAGAAALYRELIAAERLPRLVCPEGQPTAEEARETFVGWIAQNPGARSEKAIDGLFRAASAKWPCPKS